MPSACSIDLCRNAIEAMQSDGGLMRHTEDRQVLMRPLPGTHVPNRP